jgi:hypothetical protein
LFRELIAKVAGELERASIPYMIIGGQAVLIYGEPRLTKDIDVTIGVGTDKFAEIDAVVKGVGLEPLPKDPKEFALDTLVLPTIERETGLRVDFIIPSGTSMIL